MSEPEQQGSAVLARIRSSRSSLSPGEWAVGREVLAHPEEAVRLDVETLGRTRGIVEQKRS